MRACPICRTELAPADAEHASLDDCIRALSLSRERIEKLLRDIADKKADLALFETGPAVPVKKR